MFGHEQDIALLNAAQAKVNTLTAAVTEAIELLREGEKLHALDVLVDALDG